MLARVLPLTLAALLILPLVQETTPAEARKRFKTVTRTFLDNGQIAIPGMAGNGTANPYPATIAVSSLKRAKLKDVNLILRGFVHTVPDDVDVLLVAPDGRNVIVMSDAGGFDPAIDLTFTLDDEAATPLPDGGPLTGEIFRPTNYGSPDTFPAPAPLPAQSEDVALSLFDRGNPNGTWKLYVRDDAFESGSFSGGWALQIRAKVKKK